MSAVAVQTAWFRRTHLRAGLICWVDGAWRVITGSRFWPGITPGGIYQVWLAPLPGKRDYLMLQQADGAEVRLDLAVKQ